MATLVSAADSSRHMVNYANKRRNKSVLQRCRNHQFEEKWTSQLILQCEDYTSELGLFIYLFSAQCLSKVDKGKKRQVLAAFRLAGIECVCKRGRE